MGTRPGPVKQAVAAFAGRVRGPCSAASPPPPIEQNQLPPGEDPDRLAFELNGIVLAADVNFVLHDDPAVLDLARQVVHRRLGLGSDGNADRRFSAPGRPGAPCHQPRTAR